MRRAYRYVGPKKIAERARPNGTVILSAADVIHWIRQSFREPARLLESVATYVVDTEGKLRIADRQSEHVACAGGGEVLSAGEIAFEIREGQVRIVRVSNQSAGYCPEVESWNCVKVALEQVGMVPPFGFEPALVFRRCEGCGTINIIKDAVFDCDVCSEPLPAIWNFTS